MGLRLGRFALDKHLPVAAGLGGGSSDAAAALRLLAQVNGLSLDDERVRAAAQATGADVPVCLDPRARMMRGIGEILSDPMTLPELPAVLVNPGVAVPTRDVFAALARAARSPARPNPMNSSPSTPTRRRSFRCWQRGATICRHPRSSCSRSSRMCCARCERSANCLLARMSGSGATCFGLFGSSADRRKKPRAGCRPRHPGLVGAGDDASS